MPPFEFIEGLRNCVLLTFIRHNENKDIYADEINALGMTNQRKINNNFFLIYFIFIIVKNIKEETSNTNKGLRLFGHTKSIGKG